MRGAARPSDRTATIDPSRLTAPAIEATISELQDIHGQGLGALTDAVCKFLCLPPEDVACVSSNYALIYHPLVCMALSPEGMLGSTKVEIRHFTYNHPCAPKYVNVPVSLTETMNCLSDGTLFLTTPSGARFVVRVEISCYSNTVNVEAHVPADCTAVADNLFTGMTRFIHQNNIFRGQRITPSGGFMNVAHYTWDDLILPEGSKETIRRNIVDIIEKQKLYEINGIAIKRGIMFYGPPGCGKTLTGKVLASQMKGVTFIWVTPTYVSSATSITQIYSLARELSPTIVFIEDVDLIAQDRSIDNNNPVLCELLNQLDGIEENRGVITIITTNFPEVIEGALKDRPGRFDRRIEFGLPDAQTRQEMLLEMLSGRMLDPDGVNIEAVAAMCDGLTPSHLKEVINTAVMNAIDAESLTVTNLAIIEQDHLTDAVTEILENRPDPSAVSAVPSAPDADVVDRSYDTGEDIAGPAMAIG